LLGGALAVATTLVRGPTTTNKGQNDEAADDAGDGDDNLFVVCDPFAHLIGNVGPLTSAIPAFAAPFAVGTVEEVLLHGEACQGAKLGRGAAELTALRTAGVRIIARRQRAHERLALLVARGALA